MMVSAGITVRDFDLFLRFVENTERENVIELYNLIEARLRAIETTTLIGPESIETTGPNFASVYRDIRFLLKDSSLSPAVAAREIADELVSMGVASDVKSIRYLSNESFNRWARKVYERVGRSALLRAVSLTVNRKGRKPRSDWPLTSS